MAWAGSSCGRRTGSSGKIPGQYAPSAGPRTVSPENGTEIARLPLPKAKRCKHLRQAEDDMVAE
jgi:hypothetical protein